MSIKQFKSKAREVSPILLISPQSRVALSHHFKIDQREVLPKIKVFMKKYFNVVEVYEILQGINLAQSLAAEELNR
jgi:hypothetical protein